MSSPRLDHADTEVAHAEAGDQLRAILNGLPAVVAYWDCDLRNVMANEAFAELFGWDAGEMVGRSCREILGGELYRRHVAFIQRALAGEAQQFDCEIVDAQGATRYTQTSYVPDWAGGEVGGFFALITDISARRQAEEQLADEKRRMATILDAISEGVISLDGEHTLVHMNAAAAQMTGIDLRSAIGQRIEDVVTVEADATAPTLAEVVSEVAETGVAKSVEHCALLLPDDGAPVPIDYHVIRVPRHRDAQTQLVVTLRDATRARRRFAEVEERANRDPLTGLLNRQHLARREDADAEAGAGGAVAVVMLDLDRFKNVNDSAGHAAGDHVLRDVSSLLRAHTRGSDQVVRYGGDEFVVVLDGCTASSALRVAEQLVAVVASHPFEYGGRRFDIGVSAGVAVCGEDDWLPLQELLLRADHASYEAKRAGGDRVALAPAA